MAQLNDLRSIPLQNQRHEVFAQELAKGASRTDSYAAAGYARDRTAASRLSTNVNVQDRVAYLQNVSAHHAELTIERLTNELEEARKLAILSKNAGAAVSATMAKARLNGLLIHPTEAKEPIEADVRQEPPRQIARRIAFMLYRAGLGMEINEQPSMRSQRPTMGN